MSAIRITTTRLVAYGLPGLPLAVLGLPLYVYLPSFYAETLGVGLTAVGAALLLARVWDVVSDPLVGIWSDHTNLPFGRRRGMMLLGAPVVMVSVYALFVPSQSVGASYLLLWSVVVYLGWTMITLPYSAWGAELSEEYHQRTRITAVREGFALGGTVLALTLPALFALEVPSQSAMKLLSTLVLVLLPFSLLLAVLVMPEPRRHLVFPAWRTGLRVVLKNRPFIRLFAAYVLNGMANGIPATLFILFVTHVLQTRDLVGPLLVLYFLAGVAALPLWLRIARRFNKHRVWAASMLWASAVFVWVPFLSEGDAGLFIVICILSGLSLGVDMALPASMQADVVDHDQRLGGGGRTGLFFGLWGMGTKLALALAVGVSFPLLDMAGFKATGDNSDQALLALSLLYGLLPVMVKLFAVRLVWNFPLGRDWQQRAATSAETR